MNDILDVVCAIDDTTYWEAIYINGTLRFTDENAYAVDVASLLQGKPATIISVSVDLPEGEDFPDKVTDLVPCK